jgi:RNA polymerase sigma-70 factor (ECF subfamily)
VERLESSKLDPELLSAWHAAHAESLRAFVYGLLREHAAADEVVQSTFVQALIHGRGVRTGAERAWLFQVAFHEAMAIRRRAGINERCLKRRPATVAESSPESPLISRENAERVQRALKQLPVEQKLVVDCRIYEELTFQEIADRYKLPLGTVLTRMRLALQKLQKALLENP